MKEIDQKVLAEYNSNPEKLYGDWFFRNYGKSRAFQNKFAETILLKHKIGSVLDMGCACGWYLEGFYSSGVVDVMGIEYVYDMAKKYFPETVKDKIIFGNLTKEIDLNRKFDLVISLEVAEHLPSGFENTYVSNLTRHANNMILFSAAETEDGNYHLNVKPIGFWLDIFKEHGFVVSDSQTKGARDIYSQIAIRNPYKNYMARTAIVLAKA